MFKIIRQIFFILFSFSIGFMLAPSIKWVYESSILKPYDWSSEPIIINCYGKDFSELQLLRAIDFWTVRNNNIAFYEMKPEHSICKSSEHLDGFIVLRKAARSQFKHSTLASTERRTSILEIRSAVIWFRPGAQNLSNLIEHELGHAFGYGHVEIEGHLMHPDYGKMGPKFWIP
jgi:hypothetical protein